MKKKSALAAVLLAVAVTAAGCGNSLEDYKKAVEKSSQIEKAQISGEFTVNLEFNTEGLNPEEIRELSYYKNMSGSFRGVFDKSREMEIYRNYMNMGGLGFDFELYKNGEEKFIKLPIIGKYMKLDDLMRKAEQSPGEPAKMISEETAKALEREWTEILKEENVFKGKDIILTTPDGEVKTTVYTITLNESQLTELKGKVKAILEEDEHLRGNFNSFIKKAADSSGADDPDRHAEEVWNQIFADTVESFQFTAYVDIDGYIVNETIELKTRRPRPEKWEQESFHFKLDIRKWDINKDQEFNFPELTEENMLKAEELDKNMPSLFINLFEAK